MPTSLPPLLKNGWLISVQVSLTTLLGGGSVAPAWLETSSQMVRSSAMVMSGGSTRDAAAPSSSSARDLALARGAAPGGASGDAATGTGTGCSFGAGGGGSAVSE